MVSRAMYGAGVLVQGVSVRYGERPAVSEVSFELRAGELACLIGPNGAGKSSLLRCISGTLAASAGAVLIDGTPIDEFERPALARRVAVVPGETSIAFPMRVAELVALGRVPHEHPLLGLRPADHAAIERAIERVGIGALCDRDVRELSLGERQLVVLAMTIAQGARMLLLDEPTVHLDLRHQVEVMELVGELARRDGVTVLAVLHDVGLASHFFPRMLLLDKGRLIADGRPGEVLSPARLRAVFDVDPRFVTVGGAA